MMDKGQRSRSQALTSKDMEASEGEETRVHGDLSRHLRRLHGISLMTVDLVSVHAEMERSARTANTEPMCAEEFKKFLEMSRETVRIKNKAPTNTCKRQKSFTIGVNSTNNLLGSMSMIDLRTPKRKKKCPSKPMDNPVTWKTSFDIDAPRKPLKKMETSLSRSRRTVDPRVDNESWDHFDPLSASNRTMDSSGAFSTCDVLPVETVIALRKLEQKESKEDMRGYKETLGSHPKWKSRSKPNSGSKPSSKSNTNLNKDSKSRSPMRPCGATKQLSGSSRSRGSGSGSRSSMNSNGSTKKLSGSSGSRRDSEASRSPRRSNGGATKKLSGSSRSRGRLTPKTTTPKQTIDKAMFEMFNWSSNSNLDLKKTPKRTRRRRSSNATKRTASMPSLSDFGRSRDFAL